MGNPLPPPTVLQALAIGPSLGNSVRIIPLKDSPMSATTYTLVLDDDGLWKRCTNASTVTVTVPPHSAVAFPINSSILISQDGTGIVTLVAGAGVTIHSAGGLSTAKQYDVIRIFQNTLDVWTLVITSGVSSGNGFTASGGGTVGNWTATPPDDGASIGLTGHSSAAGTGGNILILSGSSASSNFDDGGSITLRTGLSNTNSSGGLFIETANNPGTDCGSGHISVRAGDSEFAGRIVLQSGASTVAHDGGLLTLAAGASAGAKGGDVTIHAGDGATLGGDLNIQAGTGLINGKIFLVNLPTSDPMETGALWNNGGVINISA